MISARTALLLAAWPLLILPAPAQDAPDEAVIEDRVSLLLAEMSVAEKAGQMTQLSLGAVSRAADEAEDPGVHQLDPESLRAAIVDRHVGSFQGTDSVAFPAAHWHELLTSLQQLATGETRHKIPLLYGIDSVHGANSVREATLFPHNLSLAATRNPELIEQCHAMTARETRASGLPWSFAPVLDVGRQPLWPRFFETFGEDVHLTSVFGEAAVRGLQGDDLAAPDRVAACGKHFLGSSFPFSGRDRSQTLLPDRYLREYFLPPFQTAMDRAALNTIMVNSGEINGIPVHANRSILTTLLRDQLAFQGVVVSGWEDIRKLHELHRVAPDLKEAVRLAVDAGVDLCMTSDYHFTENLIALVEEGAISEERLDESCRRLLRLKHHLGLFRDPLPKEELLAAIGTEEARALSLQAARESLVLLKNEGGVLPAAPGARILLTGPGCESRAALHGAWSYTRQGQDEATYPDTTPTIREAFEAAHGEELVTCIPGVTFEGANSRDVERAVRSAQNADLIVCVLSEAPGTGTPANVEDLALDANQRRLVRTLSFGKPLVLVLLTDRPRLITDIDGLADAVIFAGRPGPTGGAALHEVLTGAVNPSGKLPFTYPRSANHILPYDHKRSDTADREGGFDAFQPLYPFGHGLSYTTFQYDPLELAREELDLADSVQVSVTLTNTGARAGSEVVEVHVRDLYASIAPPVKRLRAFRKVALDPGASETLTFDIPVMELGFYGAASKRLPIPTVEPGEFEVIIGDQRAPFSVR